MAQDARIKMHQELPSRAMIRKEKKIAVKELVKVIKSAAKYRQEFLEELISKADAEGNTTLAKLRRRLLRAETSKKLWRHLKSMIKESQSGSISFILEPVEFDEQGRATAWVSPTTVQEKILAWNQKHFAQAAGTPFATKEM